MKTHTDRQYEAELQRVRDLLASMGGAVEAMIADAMTSLVEHDAALAARVIERDREVNEAERDVDEMCLSMLARRQPTASDLRFLAVGLKLVVDIERIGDIAVNVCERVLELAGQAVLKPYVDLPRMGRISREMVSDALDAFIRRDAALARTVFPRDNVVDALYAQILRELLTYMIEAPRSIYRATRLLAIAKYLERIGDHATNLAEQVVFLVEGRDVRHTGLGKPEGDVPSREGDLRGVLFVCLGNAARSQMAEGWARKLTSRGIAIASAGLEPTAVHPMAVEVMAEVGVDLASARAKPLSEIDLSAFDKVVTLCDEAACVSVPPGVAHLHWPIQDPVPHADEQGGIEHFRRVRDDLAARIEHLFRERNRRVEAGL